MSYEGYRDFKDAKTIVEMDFSYDALVNAMCLKAIGSKSYIQQSQCMMLFHEAYSEVTRRLEDSGGFLLPAEQGLKEEVQALLGKFAHGGNDAGQG